MFVHQGVDWWLIGTVTAFVIFGILIVIALWMDYKNSKKIGDIEGAVISNTTSANQCKNVPNPGIWLDVAMTKFFQK
jgi:hypothetical protein